MKFGYDDTEKDDEEDLTAQDRGDNLDDESADEEASTESTSKAKQPEKEDKAKQPDNADELKERIAKLEALQASENAKATKNAADQVEHTVRAAQERVETLKNQYEDLLSEGEKDKARAVRKEYEQIERQLNEHFTNTRLERIKQQTIAEAKYAAEFERLAEEYPQIDDAHKDFDEIMASAIAAARDRFIAKGTLPHVAIRQAVEKFLGKPGKSSASTNAAVEAATKARTTETRARNAEANKKQPPSLHDVGKDSDASKESPSEKSPLNMTDEEFDKLDSKTLAKLRGDFL